MIQSFRNKARSLGYRLHGLARSFRGRQSYGHEWTRGGAGASSAPTSTLSDSGVPLEMADGGPASASASASDPYVLGQSPPVFDSVSPAAAEPTSEPEPTADVAPEPEADVAPEPMTEDVTEPPETDPAAPEPPTDAPMAESAEPEPEPEPEPEDMEYGSESGSESGSVMGDDEDNDLLHLIGTSIGEARNMLKMEHWATHSYERHLALEAVVKSLDEAVDQFMEARLGSDDAAAQQVMTTWPIDEFRAQSRQKLAAVTSRLEAAAVADHQPEAENLIQAIHRVQYLLNMDAAPTSAP